jgi:hypothetical protein
MRRIALARRSSLMMLAFVATFLYVRPAVSQDAMPVPVERQFLLLLKVVTFDRSLPARLESDDELVIGVVYQRKHRVSLRTRDELQRAARVSTIGDIDGTPIRIVDIETEDGAGLEEAIQKSRADILYVAPLRLVEPSAIAAITRDLRVMTYTGIPEYVNEGIAVGIGLRNSRPRILVNLPACEEEGVDFSSRFLQLAEVTR